MLNFNVFEQQTNTSGTREQVWEDDGSKEKREDEKDERSMNSSSHRLRTKEQVSRWNNKDESGVI